MRVLNHHIVAVQAPEATARFFMCILGLPVFYLIRVPRKGLRRLGL